MEEENGIETISFNYCLSLQEIEIIKGDNEYFQGYIIKNMILELAKQIFDNATVTIDNNPDLNKIVIKTVVKVIRNLNSPNQTKIIDRIKNILENI